jgi:hypothetical protein
MAYMAYNQTFQNSRRPVLMQHRKSKEYLLSAIGLQHLGYEHAHVGQLQTIVRIPDLPLVSMR